MILQTIGFLRLWVYFIRWLSFVRHGKKCGPIFETPNEMGLYFGRSCFYFQYQFGRVHWYLPCFWLRSHSNSRYFRERHVLQLASSTWTLRVTVTGVETGSFKLRSLLESFLSITLSLLMLFGMWWVRRKLMMRKVSWLDLDIWSRWSSVTCPF